MLPFTLTWRKLFVVLLGDGRGHYLAKWCFNRWIVVHICCFYSSSVGNSCNWSSMTIELFVPIYFLFHDVILSTILFFLSHTYTFYNMLHRYSQIYILSRKQIIFLKLISWFDLILSRWHDACFCTKWSKDNTTSVSLMQFIFCAKLVLSSQYLFCIGPKLVFSSRHLFCIGLKLVFFNCL